MGQSPTFQLSIPLKVTKLTSFISLVCTTQGVMIKRYISGVFGHFGTEPLSGSWFGDAPPGLAPPLPTHTHTQTFFVKKKLKK